MDVEGHGRARSLVADLAADELGDEHVVAPGQEQQRQERADHLSIVTRFRPAGARFQESDATGQPRSCIA
jgi:hypothetical protein